MNKIARQLFVLIAALIVAPPASAHQQKIVISTVEHNPRTGMLEVIHRVPLHDAEHALRVQGKSAADIIADTPSRREFARYTAERFVISHDEQLLELELLGSEIDGGHLVIYLEGPSPGAGALLVINSQILTDIWTRQVNRVNIGASTEPKTLIFEAGDSAKQAVLR